MSGITKPIAILKEGLVGAAKRRDDAFTIYEVADKEVKEFEDAIASLMSRALGLPVKEKIEVTNAYESLRKAAIRIMKRENRFLHTKEISSLLNRENIFKDVTADGVSRALTSLKSGKNPEGLTTVTVGLKANTFWGFNTYMDGDGIKREYMYDISLVITSVQRKSKAA